MYADHLDDLCRLANHPTRLEFDPGGERFAIHPLGGSRFSVNGSVEWEVSDIVRYNAAKLAIPVAGPAVATAELAKVAEAAGTSPVQHMNFPDHTGSFSVSHCGSGGQVILANEVLQLIRAKLGAGGYSC